MATPSLKMAALSKEGQHLTLERELLKAGWVLRENKGMALRGGVRLTAETPGLMVGNQSKVVHLNDEAGSCI